MSTASNNNNDETSSSNNSLVHNGNNLNNPNENESSKTNDSRVNLEDNVNNPEETTFCFEIKEATSPISRPTLPKIIPNNSGVTSASDMFLIDGQESCALLKKT